MANETIYQIPLTGADDRNARIIIQNRLEGVMTQSEPIAIESVTGGLQVVFPETMPQADVLAAVRTLANVAARPGSGIGRGAFYAAGFFGPGDAPHSADQRVYSL